MVYEEATSKQEEMRHIISILLENEAGALSRVAGLFSARAYNIESLTVAPTDDPSLSRMTLVTTGTDDIVEQVCKQLNKLIDVVKLVNLTDDVHVERLIRRGQPEERHLAPVGHVADTRAGHDGRRVGLNQHL